MNKSRHVCYNCGHSSALKSNFKLTEDGKAYCVKKCLEVYSNRQSNDGARQEGSYNKNENV